MYRHFMLDELRQLENIELGQERRYLRDRYDPFDISDRRFIEMYRLPKFLAYSIFLKIFSRLEVGERSTHISGIHKYFLALRFLATGSYQRTLGQDFLSNMSQSSASRFITKVVDVIERELLNEYIKLPQTTEEIRASKVKFFEKYNFPGVIGAIDCTHIRMLNPGKAVEKVYLNRHEYFSKNFQIACDSDQKILNINARFGGSSHDAFIFKSSYVSTHLERNYNGGDRNSYILGDSGYPLTPWLLTPILAVATPSDERYNAAHRKTRCVIERLNGNLKARFRCLSDDVKLRYSPHKSGKIINVCAILHNALVKNNFPIDLSEFEDSRDMRVDSIQFSPNELPSTQILQAGRAARQTCGIYVRQNSLIIDNRRMDLNSNSE